MIVQLQNSGSTKGRFRRTAAALVRPFRTAYPDQARLVAQGPVVSEMIGIALSSGLRARRALNAGAGEGLYTRKLLNLPDLEALVEFDISYPDGGRPQIDPRQRITYGSLTQIPVINEWSDLVLCSEVLEHVEDDLMAIRELARVISPGGYLLISVPTSPAPFDPAHVREGYRLEDLTGLLCDAGFSVVASKVCMFGAFKALLRWWRVCPWIPKAIIPCWARFDRRWRLGQPMDLVLLCRRTMHQE